MKKKVKKITLIALATMLLSTNAYAYNIKNVSVNIDEMLQPLKSKVINKDGYTLVSFRDLFDMLGANVKWNEATKTIEATKDDEVIFIDTVNNKIKINNKYFDMPVSLEIIDGTTYVPLRFICEKLGMNVDWNQDTQNISIDTKDDGYKYLKLDEKGEKIISQKEAVNMAKQVNSSIKNLNDAQEYTKQVVDNLSDKIVGENYYDPAIEQILNTINELNAQIEDKDINQKIIEDTIELSVISSANAIKNTELNIISLEKSIEISEKNLESLELKYKYGMISENDLKQAKDDLKTNKDTLDNLKTNLKTQEKLLANLLGASDDIDIEVDLDKDFAKIDSINLDAYITRQREGDLSIQILKNNLKRLEDKKENFSHSASEEDLTKIDNEIKTAQRKLKDGQKDIENKIRTSYDNLVSMRDKDKKLKIDLQKAKDDYNKVVANYINGNATLNNVEQAELGILNVEKQIEENKNNFAIAFYTFEKPYLLQ